MKIVIDTREQRPLDFSRYDCEIMRATLPTGDYSLDGMQDAVALERKSIDDLVSCCMGSNRDRFERELQRGRGLDFFAVVAECSMQDIAEHRYKSQMLPHAVLQSILTFQVRYFVPFLWAGNRRGASYVIYWTLEKYSRGVAGMREIAA